MIKKITSQPFFDLIVAVDSNNGIGFFNKESQIFSIPWNIDVDIKFFMDSTTRGKQNVVIMGKNTFLSIGKLLTNRTNIVITKSSIEGVITCKSLDSALDYCATNIHNADNIFVIGGSKLYEESFNHKCLRFSYITRISHDFGCNIFIKLPILDFKLEWKKKFNVIEKNKNVKVLIQFRLYSKKDNKVDPLVPLVELNTNIYENNYLDILEELTKSNLRGTRNANTYSLCGKMITFPLRDKTFPMLTTKKLSLKIIVEELLFFLRGETNTAKLSEKGIKIWEANTSREFLDKLNFTHYKDKDMGPMYGQQFRHFNAPYESGETDYTGKGVDQLQNCVELLKKDPTSRRIIMTSFNPAQVFEGVLHPCHGIVIQFYVEDEKYLCCLMYQRSADIFLGFPINIASYSLFTYIMCELVNNDKEYNGIKLEPGKVVISLGDYHLYETHYDAAIRQILRPSKPFPKMNIKRKISRVEDFILDDFELYDYNAYPTIKAEMIA